MLVPGECVVDVSRADGNVVSEFCESAPSPRPTMPVPKTLIFSAMFSFGFVLRGRAQRPTYPMWSSS